MKKMVDLFLAWFIRDKKKRTKAIDKAKANIKNEAWVDVINVGFDDDNDPNTGWFELDWNNAFIEKLKDSGYIGNTDEELVDHWFRSLAKGVLEIAGELPELADTFYLMHTICFIVPNMLPKVTLIQK